MVCRVGQGRGPGTTAAAVVSASAHADVRGHAGELSAPVVAALAGARGWVGCRSAGEMGLAAGVHGDDDLIVGPFAQKTGPFKYRTIKRGNGRGFHKAPGTPQ